VLPLAHPRRGFQQQAGADVDRLALPIVERLPRGVDGLFDVLAAAALEAAEELALVRGIDRLERLQAGDVLAADDERVLGAEFGTDFLQRRFHGGAVLGFAKVGQRLILEFAEDRHFFEAS
jgi:hypothetical protein